MPRVERLIQDYLEALAKLEGEARRERVRVRWTGGSSVVIEEAGQAPRLVDLETFALIVRNLKRRVAEAA